jgi:RNA recognition motif-containing protein
MPNNIYVGNLGNAATVDDLLELFGQYGAVRQARVVVNRETGHSHGFGFVEMESDRDAEKAIQALNGAMRDNVPLEISLVENRENHSAARASSEFMGCSPGEPSSGNGINRPTGKLPPELLEWARRQFTEEEIIAGVREIRETGGVELKDFIEEIEDILSSPHE